MEKSTILIGLTLFTLLVGIAIAAYQLWSADKSQQQGERSALAARFGSKVPGSWQPTDQVLTPDPRGQAREMNAASDPAAEAAARAQPRRVVVGNLPDASSDH